MSTSKELELEALIDQIKQDPKQLSNLKKYLAALDAYSKAKHTLRISYDRETRRIETLHRKELEKSRKRMLVGEAAIEEKFEAAKQRIYTNKKNG